MQSKIGFIGSGNIAECIAVGLLKQNWENHQIMVFSPNASNKPWLQQNSIKIVSNLQQLSECCDILILATKPQQAQQALETISLNSEQCLISVAAGISTDFLHQVLDPTKSNHIIRAMPNTPSLVGNGVCGLFSSNLTQQKFGEIAEAIFSSIGSFVWVQKESLMDLVTAVSGSGPAYYFLFVEGVISAAIGLGMDKQSATTLAIETLTGAAALLKSKQIDPTLLRQQVTSPRGTTAAAIASFEENHIHQLIFDAISAANDRGVALNRACLETLNTDK